MSLQAVERARKGFQLALRMLEEPGKAGDVANAMGLADSSASRIKNERLEEAILFLAHLGLKVVPADAKCMDPRDYDFLVEKVQRMVRIAPGALFGADE